MPSPVLYDLQGAQSVDHRDRGIARYVVELALAIETLAPGRIAAYLLNPGLALPGGIEPLVATKRLRFVDEVGAVPLPDEAILHLPSTVELAIPLDRLFRPDLRRSSVPLVVTLFDLVQEAMPEEYLEDPGVRRRYRSRLELARQADGVIAISEHTRREATRLLGIPPRRISAVPLVASPAFAPAGSPAESVRAARSALPELWDDFVLYTAGSDGRKNLERLLEAWARLPVRLRSRHQLVVACHLPPLRRNHLEVMAQRLGIANGVLLTGFVDEATLVRLNQAAALAVMPSVDEGFGLPVAEALATGTPAIGSDRTSIPELLPPEALFDPTDPSAIAAAITRALSDTAHREELRQWAARPRRTWRDVAVETLAVYDAVAFRRRPRLRLNRGTGRSDMRIAFTTPLPPQPGGVADYSAKLLEELAAIDGITVDVYVDGPTHARDAIVHADAPRGTRALPLAALERVEAFAGRYDEVVYSVGNSEFHTGSVAALRRRSGVVLAHDVRLTNLYRFAAWQHPEVTPGGFHETVQRMYRGRVPVTLGAGGRLDADEADRWGVLMARDVIAHSRRFLVTSDFAAELARLDACAEHRDGRITVVPFGFGHHELRGAPPAGRRPGPPLVASFGVVNALKSGALIVEAFALALTAPGAPADARLAFVGRTGPADAEAIRRRATELDVVGRVDVTGEVDAGTYSDWLGRAWVAVQLRAATNGESSAAVGDCLSAGIPTIVTAIGPNRSLPGDAVVPVAAAAGPDDVSRELTALLASPERRDALGAKARAYAQERSFRSAATALYEVVRSLSSGG